MKKIHEKKLVKKKIHVKKVDEEKFHAKFLFATFKRLLGLLSEHDYICICHKIANTLSI